jgi:CpeT/CpcT family (DUF1001)
MPSLLTNLSQALIGDFNNREQAIADPVWFVHLRLWHRSIDLFTPDSKTIFAEQANSLKLDQPYRQRLLRISPTEDPQFPLQVQYYRFKDFSSVKGAGQNPELLQNVTEDDIELLPGCILQVKHQGGDRFQAKPPADTCCYFPYDGEIRQVTLGFEVSPGKFSSYDKGVEPSTGKALWGAIMGAYDFTKQ